MSPWKILSKEGLSKGINSFGNSIKILGSQKTTLDDLKCCCGFSGCALCDDQDPDGVDSFTVTGALFANKCLLYWTVVPFEFTACEFGYYGNIVKTGRYPEAKNEFAFAVYHTFDGMAIKSGYVACLYFQKNFNRSTGDVDIPEPDMIFKGPKVINNTRRYPSPNTPSSAPFPLFHSTAYTGDWHSRFNDPSIIVCKLPSPGTVVSQYGFEKAYWKYPDYRTEQVYSKANPLIE